MKPPTDAHQPPTAPSDPLLARLRGLPAVRLDDMTAARTLARAETALPSVVADVSARRRWSVRFAPPAALALWAVLYVWGAVGALARLFPTAAPPAVALTTPPRATDRAGRSAPAQAVPVHRPDATPLDPAQRLARLRGGTERQVIQMIDARVEPAGVIALGARQLRTVEVVAKLVEQRVQ